MADFGKGFKDLCTLMKVSGSGGLTALTKLVVPFYTAIQNDPTNVSYQPMCDSSVGQAVLTKGVRTPTLAIDTAFKDSWLTDYKFLDSLLITTDSANDTDLWAAKFWGDDARQIEGMRCATVSLSHDCSGGPIAVSMGFPNTGDGVVQSFGTAPSTTAGLLLDATGCDYGSSPTADNVLSWTLNLQRAQRFTRFSNHTSYYPDKIQSGGIGGTITLVQPVLSSTIPSTTMTIRVYAPSGSSPLFTLVLYLNLDVAVKRRTPGFNVIENTYTLMNSSAGGSPVTIS